MSTDWTQSKKWPDADKAAEMLSALGKIKGHPPDVAGEAMPEVLALLKVLGHGIGEMYAAMYMINRYNQATHEQFAKQIEATRSLVQAIKEQGAQIKRLTRRVESLEKKLEKKRTGAAPVKKVGWFG
jgi:TolA-binding protein